MKNIGLLNEEVKKLLNPGFDSLEGLKKIDQGKNRMVYKIIDNIYGEDVENKAVKVDFDIENKMEVKAWNDYKNTEYEKYIVPIRHHSNDYSWIIMDYGEPIEPSYVVDDLYKKLNDIGTDISKNDFVIHDNRQKCCDYASLSLF